MILDLLRDVYSSTYLSSYLAMIRFRETIKPINQQNLVLFLHLSLYSPVLPPPILQDIKMAPPRSYGLPYHILYLVVSLILIAIPAFSTAASVYWLSANTSTLQLRFGSRDYCGYNATAVQGVALDSALGCIYAGKSIDCPL